MKNFLLPFCLCAAVITGVNFASADRSADTPYVVDVTEKHIDLEPGDIKFSLTASKGGEVRELYRITADNRLVFPDTMVAQADTGPVDAGATASSPAAVPDASPADKLHDPVASPALAFDDLKAAKKLGWGLLVLAGLIMLCRLVGRLGGVFKPLSTGRAAVVTAAIGTVAVTAYNALALGGTWMAAAAAAIVALAAFWNSHAQPKEPPQS